MLTKLTEEQINYNLLLEKIIEDKSDQTNIMVPIIRHLAQCMFIFDATELGNKIVTKTDQKSYDTSAEYHIVDDFNYDTGEDIVHIYLTDNTFKLQSPFYGKEKFIKNIGDIELLMAFQNNIGDEVKKLDYLIHTEKYPEGVKFSTDIVQKAFLIKNNVKMTSISNDDNILKTFGKKIKGLKYYGAMIADFNDIHTMYLYIPFDKNNLNKITHIMQQKPDIFQTLMDYYELDNIDINWNSNNYEFDCELYQIEPFIVESKSFFF